MGQRLVELLKYLLLGFVQGACEILPISSSGHLIIFQYIMGREEVNLAFSVFLHFGSLIAVSIFLRKRIVELLSGTYKYLIKKDRNYYNQAHYCLLLVLSTIVTGIIGLVFEDKVQQISTLGFVGCALIINGICLLIVNRISNKATKTINNMPWWKAVLIGLGQGVGILPGISRSGATLGTSIAVGVKKEVAAEYAFLLFIPVEFGALIISIDDLMTTEKSLIIPYILGMVIAAITTYFALVLFLGVIKKKKINYFSFYSLIVGVICTLVYFF